MPVFEYYAGILSLMVIFGLLFSAFCATVRYFTVVE